jgi:hypothetical protein
MMRENLSKRTRSNWVAVLAAGTLSCGLAPQARADAAQVALTKTQYEQAAAHLEPGGDLYLYARVDGLLRKLVEAVVQGLSAAAPHAAEMAKARDWAVKVHAFLDKNGFYAAQNIGISAVPLDDGLNSLRVFVGRDAQTAALPLWRTLHGSAPRALQSLNLIAQDAALVQISTAEPAQLWQLVRLAVQDLAPAEGREAFDAFLRKLPAQIGVDADTLARSLGAELFLSLHLSESAAITLPLPGNPFSMPTPSLLLGLAVVNDSLPRLIERQIVAAQLPLERTTVGDTALLTLNIPLPLPLPFPLRPTLAHAQGFLLIGSSPETVRAALDARRNGKDLAQNRAFQEAFAGTPWRECNGLGYMTKRFGKLVQDYQRANIAQMETMVKQADTSATVPLLIYTTLMREFAMDEPPAFSALVTRNLPHGVATQGRSTMSGGEWLAGSTLAPAMAVVGAGLMLPAVAGARNRARGVINMNELRQLGMAAIMYSMDHDEAFPAKISDLENKYGVALANLANDASFVWVSGLTAADAAQTVLAFRRPQAGQPVGMLVLYVDGSVKHIDENAWRLKATTPTLFFGTTDPAKVAELQRRVTLPAPYAAQLKTRQSGAQ